MMTALNKDMPQPSSPPARFDAADDTVVEYRAISPWAVAGLLVGLASATTLLSPGLWILALLGVALNAWALWQIMRRGSLVGRTAAVWGLALSTLFVAYVPAENYFYRYFLGIEARQIGLAWFQAIARKDPAGLHRIMMDPRLRGAPTARPDAYYKANPRAAEALKKIVDEPLVRTLFALGSSAQAHFYETAGYGSAEGNDSIEQIFSVTFDLTKPDAPKPQKTTFFVSLLMERLVVGDQKAQWFVNKAQVPILRATDGGP